MKRNNIFAACAAMILATGMTYAQSINVSRKGDTTIVKINNPKKYLILPIEEEKPEARVKLDTGSPADTWMDVRLAQGTTDYYVPFELGTGRTATVKMLGVSKDAVALKQLKTSDTFDVTNTDYYRPLYHHTPAYGWMNDANGLVYKDGEYHLYFQYNPYGSKWGNMHWGHSVSKDLVHWEHLAPAIARDTLGHIFSGSTVVDKYNSAGFGKDAIIAFYTSHSERPGVGQVQVQCLAYSTDNGRTYTKYEKNPILTPFDGLKDFRDPKVFRYEPAKAWYMIVSADKEMRFYKSENLKDWIYVSAFGKGYGAQPNQFECPDFFPLTCNGVTKYVMIVNINPGCLFGGSATEYFVGDFDGTTFKCDNDASVAKFLDWGKDHYATVTFSNTGSRVVAVPWVSNWQYAGVTPIRQYRGSNGLPRELKLYEKDGDYYVSAGAIDEMHALRHDESTLANGSTRIAEACEIAADITPAAKGKSGLVLYNDKGEETTIYFDMDAEKFVMDRTKSGLIEFGTRAERHEIERKYFESASAGAGNVDRVALHALNYVNDFALATWAPLNLCNGGKYHVDVYVDKCSIEVFVDGGRIAMTNLVFPTTPYTHVRFFSDDRSATVDGKVWTLK